MSKLITQMRGFVGFYFGSFPAAFKMAYIWAAAVATILGALIPLLRALTKPKPEQEVVMNSLVWQIPIWFFIIFFLLIFLYIPYMKYQESEKRVKDKEADIANLQAQLDQVRTKPCFIGAIESETASPVDILSWDSQGVTGYSQGCEILVVAHFANSSPVQTSIRKVELVVSVGGISYHAELLELKSGQVHVSFDEYFNNQSLKESLDTIAIQGLLFKGYLAFSLPNVLTKDSDEIRIDGLLITDAFGGTHEIKPVSDGVVSLKPREKSKSAWDRIPRPRLVELIPPLILPRVRASSELLALIDKAFPPGDGSPDRVHQPLPALNQFEPRE